MKIAWITTLHDLEMEVLTRQKSPIKRDAGVGLFGLSLVQGFPVDCLCMFALRVHGKTVGCGTHSTRLLLTVHLMVLWKQDRYDNQANLARLDHVGKCGSMQQAAVRRGIPRHQEKKISGSPGGERFRREFGGEVELITTMTFESLRKP